MDPDIYKYYFSKGLDYVWKNIDFSEYLIGALMPSDSMDILTHSIARTTYYNKHKEDDEYLGYLVEVLGAAASTLNYERYEKVSEILDDPIEFPLVRYYIEDDSDIPEDELGNLNLPFILKFGCPKILAKYLQENDGEISEPGNWVSPISVIPSNLRAKEIYRLLYENLDTNGDWLYTCLEYWSWIAYGKSSDMLPKSFTAYWKQEFFDILEDYIYCTANEKYIERWINYTGKIFVPRIDLLNYPKLSDAVHTILSKGDLLGWKILIRNFFTPELYQTKAESQTITDKILYLPNWESAEKYYEDFVWEQSKNSDIWPLFLEPRIYYETKLLK